MYKILATILCLTPVLCYSQASTHIIPIDTCYGQGNLSYFKTPGSLFNGLTTSINRLDRQGGVNSSFCTPYSFVNALGDSCYDNIKIEFFNEFATTNWTVTMYDSNRVQLATYSFSRGFQGSGGNYGTMAGIPDTISKPVRFIWFTVSDPTNTDLRQFRIYGDPIAKCSKVKPDPVATVRPDPGIAFMGGSAIDDKDTNYLKLSNGDPLYWIYRDPRNVFYTAYNQDGTFSNQPFSFTFYGDINLRKYNFMKYHGVVVQNYYNGSCILTIPPTDSSASFNTKSASNNFKDIPVASDSTVYGNWVNTGRMWKAVTHLFGRNTSSTLTPDYKVYGTNTTPGQNKVSVIEVGNEDNKTWQGLTGYHSPEVLLSKLKIAYDSIKNVDPTMKVYLGATFFADSMFLKAMYWWNYWKYGSKSLPMDGFCFNQYLSTAYGGQPQGGGGYSAISPEQWQTTGRMILMGRFRDSILPGRGIEWTESGFALSSGSNYDVHAVTGIADSLVMANMFIRTVERVAAAPNCIDAIFNYFQTGDGSSDFNSMAVVTEQFLGGGGSYSGSVRHPIWWWIATRGQTLKNYKGWSTMLIDGDSTGVTISRYDHLTEATQKVYHVVRGTYNGTTNTNYVVNVPNALNATLITMAYNDENGVPTSLSVAGGQVTIPTVNEGSQYLVVTFASTSGNPDVLIRGRKVRVTN